MKDIELAKSILLEENQSLVLVKDGEVLYKSKDRGIKPMLTITNELKEKASGSSLADKVIGKGAALLCVNLNIKHVYGDLMSQAGIDMLKKNHIKYEFKQHCEYIKNREGTDYCPIEKLSMDVEEPKELLEKIKVFFASIAKD